MKTQINDIINGERNQIFNMNNSKYSRLPKWQIENGKFLGAGTSYEERIKRFSTVMHENGDAINAEFCGEQIMMRRKSSSTGKTSWYIASISVDTYRKLETRGISTAIEPKPMLVLNQDCTLTMMCGRFQIAVGTEYIEII